MVDLAAEHLALGVQARRVRERQRGVADVAVQVLVPAPEPAGVFAHEPARAGVVVAVAAVVQPRLARPLPAREPETRCQRTV